MLLRMINTDFDKSIFVDVCSGPVVRDLSHYPAGPSGAAEALSKKTEKPSNIVLFLPRGSRNEYLSRSMLPWNEEGPIPQIEHRSRSACSLESKSLQALNLSIVHGAQSPLTLRASRRLIENRAWNCLTLVIRVFLSLSWIQNKMLWPR